MLQMMITMMLMMITLLNCCDLFKPFLPDAALADTSISSSPAGREWAMVITQNWSFLALIHLEEYWYVCDFLVIAQYL